METGRAYVGDVGVEAPEYLHVWLFGKERHPLVLLDGIESCLLVVIEDGHLAMGEAVDVDVEQSWAIHHGCRCGLLVILDIRRIFWSKLHVTHALRVCVWIVGHDESDE